MSSVAECIIEEHRHYQMPSPVLQVMAKIDGRPFCSNSIFYICVHMYKPDLFILIYSNAYIMDLQNVIVRR